MVDLADDPSWIESAIFGGKVVRRTGHCKFYDGMPAAGHAAMAEVAGDRIVGRASPVQGRREYWQ